MKASYLLPLLLSLPTLSTATPKMYECLVNGDTRSVALPCDQYLKFFGDRSKVLVSEKSDEPVPGTITPEEAPIATTPEQATGEDKPKEKSWLEKRDEERAAKKAQAKEAHDKRVRDASNRAKFKKLIHNKEIAVGMSRDQVIKSWGKPSSSKQTVTESGTEETLTFRRYKNRQYTGSDEVTLRNGEVISFTKD